MYCLIVMDVKPPCPAAMAALIEWHPLGNCSGLTQHDHVFDCNYATAFVHTSAHKDFYNMATTHTWQFAPSFRRNAFGWKSDLPIKRIKEALAEIKAVAKKDPVLAAQGSVLFLEKLAPAINHVDSSSGRIGSTVNRAIDALTPIIAKADVTPAERHRWLDRLWQAFEADDIPYLEHLGDVWGELCASPDMASRWADTLTPTLSSMLENCARTGYFGHFKGTSACLSALFAAGRHAELLALIKQLEYKYVSWHYREWGAKAMLAAGQHEQAIAYAEEARGPYAPLGAIAAFCESALLHAGHADQAFERYALAAPYATTNVAAFKAIVKKYPNVPKETVLHALVNSQPGQEGKWFAAAKDAGFYELAIEWANRSPSDPRTLIRAAKEFALSQPDFALAAAMTALRGIASGWGYEITNVDVNEAYGAAQSAAAAIGVEPAQVNADVRALISACPDAGDFVAEILQRQLAL